MCAKIYARVIKYLILYTSSTNPGLKFPLKLIKQHEKVVLTVFEFDVAAADSLAGYCRYDMEVAMSRQMASLEPAREVLGGGKINDGLPYRHL